MLKDKTVHGELLQGLITGVFKPGEKLRPDQLKKEFDCSSSTIREALFRLSTEGLVEFQEQRGFRVPRESPELRHDLTQMRIILECEGACLSIRLGGVAWEARLAAAHHKLSHIETRIRDSGDARGIVDLWTDAELEFHETLIDGCRSDILKRTHRRIYNQFRQQLASTNAGSGFYEENVEEHRAILDAALERDETEIRRMIHQHLARNFIRPVPLPL